VAQCSYALWRPTFSRGLSGGLSFGAWRGTRKSQKDPLTLAGFTFLNPHVYLDTIGLIGAVSAQYDADSLRYAFATGASLGSLVFFCTLGFGARLLAPLMGSSKAWRVLDILVGMTMWAIAALLVCS